MCAYLCGCAIVCVHSCACVCTSLRVSVYAMLRLARRQVRSTQITKNLFKYERLRVNVILVCGVWRVAREVCCHSGGSRGSHESRPGPCCAIRRRTVKCACVASARRSWPCTRTTQWRISRASRTKCARCCAFASASGLRVTAPRARAPPGKCEAGCGCREGGTARARREPREATPATAPWWRRRQQQQWRWWRWWRRRRRGGPSEASAYETCEVAGPPHGVCCAIYRAVYRSPDRRDVHHKPDHPM